MCTAEYYVHDMIETEKQNPGPMGQCQADYCKTLSNWSYFNPPLILFKAYYRRASANMALGKFKLALKDFEAVSLPSFCSITLKTDFIR